MSSNQVLIVGAGPTGLTMALFLAKAGVIPRIIAKTSGPGQASRAMVVQARTLEFYRQLGFADEVVSNGIQIKGINIREHNRVASKIDVDALGDGLSLYPFLLSYPQDDHEKLLVQQLKAAGVEVEWDTELLEMRDTDGDSVRVTLGRKDGTQEQCAVAYLCGCDGARSTTRHDLNLGFAGGTSDKTYFVADVQATGEATADQTFSFCLGPEDFMLVLPVRSNGMNRLIGVLPEALTGREGITFDDIRPTAEAADIHVATVNWFSTYRVSHRVADHFRSGRVFVSGDAGHIHSPVGGQGMNTGIGDAMNLSWKLAAVVQGRAAPSLLDTYEQERIAFARSLVATTDKLFQLMTGSGMGHRFVRETLFPHLMPFALGFSATRASAFRLLSQIHINYRGSALSEGTASHVHGGDRLPWVTLEGGSDNFQPLESVDWQAHVYGEAGQALIDVARNAKLALHAFGWSDAMEEAGLKRDALYLVRPDGYVALANDAQDIGKLQALLTKFQILPRPVPVALS